VVHDVCLQNLDVTFALDRAGLVGADGATHQGIYDYAYLRTLPNMLVMAPKDENELQHMVATAIDHPGPAAVRFPRGSGFGVPLDPDIKPIPIGESELLRDGDDAVIVAVGEMVHPSMEAADLLAADGISAAVVNARFVKPLDTERLLPLIERCGLVVTVEAHTGPGGFGGAVLEALASADLAPAAHTLTIPDRLIEHGSTLESLGLDAQGIARTVSELVRRVRSGGGAASETGASS
jgi:1-deoxy-D-xylulose-5-phosphate synthase